jgi:acyl-CoA thioester hydrolase
MTAATVDYGHIEHQEVYFDDLDAMGLLHNARYAVLTERALTSFWAERGHGWSERPDLFVAVAEFAITYLVPVRGTGRVGVHFWIDRLGASSATYGFRVVSADGSVTHARGHRVHIRLDPATLRPMPWSADTREVASSLLRGGSAAEEAA